MPLSPTWPHCSTCSCQPLVPETFTSDVRHLKVDLDRIAQYRVGRGQDARIDEHRAISVVYWRPDYTDSIQRRIRFYRRLVADGTCGNIREAVKMAAIRRRESEAKETARHADRLSRDIRVRKPDGYDRARARKLAMVRGDGGPCSYCGVPDSRVVDHKLPESRGGDHRRTNLALSCLYCNSEKNNRTPAEWRQWRLDRGLCWPPLPRTNTKKVT